jgi:hypothetical protein
LSTFSGSVHVFKVEHNPQQDKYLDVSMVKKIDPTAEGPILAVRSFSSLTFLCE